MLSNNGVFMDKVIDKPIVHYIGDVQFDNNMYPKYTVAHVYTLDHPVWGRDKVRTSIVLKQFPDGSFETLNTIYKPFKKDPLDKMAENARELGLDYDN
jgi:hypothetical protein